METITRDGQEERLARTNSCGSVNNAHQLIRTTNTVIFAFKFTLTPGITLKQMAKNGSNASAVLNGNTQSVKLKQVILNFLTS
jgi:hypothetical protein